jgi:uncharacterized protein
MRVVYLKGMGYLVKPIENRVDTVFVHVTNLESAIRWYSDLLGLEVREGELNGPIYTLDMGPGRPGITLDNHCLDSDYKLTTSNQPLFTLSASDIHAAFKHAKKLGAGITSEIQTFPDLSEFTFTDPDGNMIMVCSCFS